VGKYILLGVLTLGLLHSARSQNNCEANLTQAQEWLDQGRLNGISALLNACLNNGFTKEQKVQAFRILTMTYLYNDDPYAAEQSYLALLAEDPEYQLLDTDPIELEHLGEQYITTPIISWRFMVGANTSFITVIHENGTYNINDSQQKYTPDFGFNVNGAVDVHFSKMVSITAGLELSSHKFRYSNQFFEGTVQTLGATQTVSDEQTKEENFIEASLPISIKLDFPINNSGWSVYAYGGYSINYNWLYRADLRITPGDAGSGSNVQATVSGPKLDIGIIRKDWTQSFLGGVGVKKRFGYKYGFIDIRYKGGLTNLLQEEKQFSFENNEELQEYTFTYAMVDDDFRLNALSINVGVIIPMYRPRKKNTVTIQTIVNGWFSKKDKTDE
jgi:hypothetical protein